MASLKEVKNRIASVNSTKKITSAMKMVASAKLHKTQTAMERMLPYQRQLQRLLSHFMAYTDAIKSGYVETRAVRRVAVVVFSSNSSLCGSFNANITRMATKACTDYVRELGADNVLVYAVGRKAGDALRKAGFHIEANLRSLTDKPNFGETATLANELMELFTQRKVDGVELLYHHSKNSASQVCTRQTYLPLSLPHDETDTQAIPDYIVEPSAEELMQQLLPKVLRLNLYAVLLDTVTSEHAARTTAMQIATENAEELLQELTIQYNKSRQQAITNELLDMASGKLE